MKKLAWLMIALGPIVCWAQQDGENVPMEAERGARSSNDRCLCPNSKMKESLPFHGYPHRALGSQ